MKLTFDTPENPNSKMLIFEVPSGLWRFNEQRLDDGRCLTTIVFIHGEKEDLGEFAHHLPSAVKTEFDINHGVKKEPWNPKRDDPRNVHEALKVLSAFAQEAPGRLPHRVEVAMRMAEEVDINAPGSMKFLEPHVIVPIWALVAIDYKGAPALIEYGPVEWWDEFMAGNGFADIFDAKLPKEAGVYWWHGHYKANPNAGRAMPNGEVDDWPGEWVGKWTKQEMPR